MHQEIVITVEIVVTEIINAIISDQYLNGYFYN